MRERPDTLAEEVLELAERRRLLLILFDAADHELRVRVGNAVEGVEVLEDVRGVRAGVLQNDVLAGRVQRGELAHVVDLVLDDDPGVAVGLVLRDLLQGVDLVTHDVLCSLCEFFSLIICFFYLICLSSEVVRDK